MNITLFGRFAVHTGEAAIQFQTRKIETLFAYLAAHAGTPFTRTQLATLLWGDYTDKKAKRNLTNSLVRIKRAFQTAGATSPLAVARQTIAFTLDEKTTIDLHRFDTLWARCEESDRAVWAERGQIAQWLTEAAALYQGAFLEGVALPDSIEFDMWVVVQRQRYHERALLMLESIADYHLNRGNWGDAERFAQQQLELEAWHERAHQQLIRLYIATNRPHAAHAQYERCTQILWEELGVAPSILIDSTIAALQQTQQTNVVHPAPSRIAPTELKHNLPTEYAPFLGRTNELAQLRQLIRERVYRLITLVGHGGAGKTRLGLALARTQLSYFAHGVFFVSLVGVQSAENIPLAIGNALKISFTGNQPPLDQLCNILRERELLLMLDNFEHLLAQPAAIDAILTLFNAATDVVFIITSRSQLWVRAETIFAVGGLAYPDSVEATETIESVDSYEAIQLFVERTRRLRLTFELHQEVAAVVRICQLVDGLPLAIELAATQSGMANSHIVAAALEASMDTLQTPMRDIPDRQRSLLAVFDYSWQLISPLSRQILARLSIFRDGFGLAQVMTVVPAATIDQLNTLQRYSLLRQDEGGRYSLHEMVRQFAAARLDSAEQASLESIYLHTYLTHLANQQAALAGAEPHLAVVMLLPDLNNIQHAWRLGVDQQQYFVIQQATRALSDFLQLQGLHYLGRDLFAYGAEAVSTVAPETMSHLLTELARFHIRLSQFDQGLAYAQQARELAIDHDQTWATGNAVNVISEALWRKGEYQPALDMLNAHDDVIESSESYRLLGSLKYNLACIYQRRAEFDLATPLFQHALAIWQKLSHSRFEANTLNAIALLKLNQNQLDLASAHFQSALSILQSMHHQHEIAQTHANLAALELKREDYKAAIAYCLLALDYYEESGATDELSLTLNNLGWSQHKLNDNETAQETLHRALHQAKVSGSRLNQLWTLSNLAEVKIALGETEAGVEIYQETLAGLQQLKRSDLAQIIEERLESLQQIGL